MMKIKNFEDTLAELTPERREKVNALTRDIIQEYRLDELRKARKVSQTELAERLGVKQPAIARLEKRVDMYLSTLQNIITGLGGSLVLVAHFPEGDVQINNLSELREAPIIKAGETAKISVGTYGAKAKKGGKVANRVKEMSASVPAKKVKQATQCTRAGALRSNERPPM